MAQERTGFDLSKIATGEKVVLGAAVLYFVWAFFRTWYSFSVGVEGVIEVSGSINGLRGFTFIAWLLAIVAVAEIVLRRAGTTFNLPLPTGTAHLAVGGAALVCTLLGLVTAPTGFGIGWGIFVALVLAAAWTYGAYMIYSEPSPRGSGSSGEGFGPAS
jgi:hypothetical protein